MNEKMKVFSQSLRALRTADIATCSQDEIDGLKKTCIGIHQALNVQFSEKGRSDFQSGVKPLYGGSTYAARVADLYMERDQ